MLTDFQNSVTVVFSDKFATNLMPHYPPHLSCVAALSCERYETKICEILLHLVVVVVVERTD